MFAMVAAFGTFFRYDSFSKSINSQHKNSASCLQTTQLERVSTLQWLVDNPMRLVEVRGKMTPHNNNNMNVNNATSGKNMQKPPPVRPQPLGSGHNTLVPVCLLSDQLHPFPCRIHSPQALQWCSIGCLAAVGSCTTKVCYVAETLQTTGSCVAGLQGLELVKLIRVFAHGYHDCMKVLLAACTSFRLGPGCPKKVSAALLEGLAARSVCRRVRM